MTKKEGKMRQELVTKETNLPTELQGSWGSEEIDNEDIVLPKLLLMQAMSEAVSEKETAEAGDIIKSTSEQVVGGREKPVKIIPLSCFKTWVLSMKDGSRYAFKSVEPSTPANINRALEWTDELGNEWRADKALNFYVLLPEEITAASNGEGACIPCLVSFRRTSYMAGRKLASGMKESQFLNQPAASRVYELRANKRTNDLGTFYVYDVGTAGKATVEQVTFAKQWFDSLKTAKVKIDAVEDEA